MHYITFEIIKNASTEKRNVYWFNDSRIYITYYIVITVQPVVLFTLPEPYKI